MVTEVYDLEVLQNLFTYTGYCLQDKKYYHFIIHKDFNQTVELYNHLKRDSKMAQVGFNNENFDYPLEHYFLTNYERLRHLSGQETAVELYNKAQQLIESTEYTGILDKHKIIIQYDLFRIWHYNNKARLTSLKDLQFVMQMDSIEEMPFDHTHWITTQEEINDILKYNKHDVESTLAFLNVTLGKTEYSQYKGKDKIKLRAELSQKFNTDVHNYSDVGIGEQLMLLLYSKETNQNPWDVNKLRTERNKIDLKDCVPSWCKIESNEFKTFLKIIEKTTLNKDEEFKFSVIFHGIKFNFGLGGTHGCIKSGVYESNDTEVIADFDVASLYPSIAKSLTLYPAHLGPEFTNLYNKFIEDRIAEKRKPKEERDNVLIEGYKLILNGVYGGNK